MTQAPTAISVPVPATPGKSQPIRWPARRFVLAVITALGLYVCYLMTVPLLPALTWAVGLAVVAWPMHRWLRSKIAWPGAAAGLSVVVVTLILVVPVAIVTVELVKETQALIEWLRQVNGDGTLRAKVESNPRLAPMLAWTEEYVDLPAESRRLAETLTGSIAGLARGSIETFAQALIMLFVLFYLFRDGHHLMGDVRSLTPLSRPETERLRKRVRDTVEATLYGRLLMAAIQGALGGLMFWWLGLPAPVLWGVVMAFLSVIPVLGSFVVWIPVALFLAIDGQWGKALILTLWGTCVIAMIDNVLYPVFVGKKLQLHSLVIFVSLVGGLAVFGAAGVVLGPILVAVTDGLLDLWRRPTEDAPSSGELTPSGSLLLPT